MEEHIDKHNQEDDGKENKEKQESYLVTGMLIGLSLGAFVGIFLSKYIGVTSGLGMLWGLIIGANIKKK